jgi:hypothetical protein
MGADATTLLVADLVPSLSLGPEWDPGIADLVVGHEPEQPP